MSFDIPSFELLIEEAIEGRLTPDGYLELKRLVLNDPKALDHYIAYLYNHAALEFQAGPGSVDEDKMRMLFDLPPSKETLQELLRLPDSIECRHEMDKARRKQWFPRVLTLLLGMALIVVFGCFFAPTFQKDRSFATITKTTNCLWGDSTAKTAPGSRLGHCILRLEQGVALIHYDCGVTVSLEGPSVFEIKKEKHGILHSGRLMATIETPEGQGFTVDTPDSSIKDLGTKFGVYAPKNEPSIVDVIDGSIEISSRTSDKTYFLQKGESLVFASQQENADLPRVSPASRIDGRFDTIQLSTAAGRGKEAWTIFDPDTLKFAAEVFPRGISDAFLLVKADTFSRAYGDRKAIFSIDMAFLTEKEKSAIEEAVLYLSYGPTELGYATGVTDSTFTVYGLIDESLDDWDPATLGWTNFPGNDSRSKLLAKHWTSLGTFMIKQGSREGIVQIDGESLTNFIQRDTNKLVTFAIVCDTYAIEDYSLVFGFANKYHPTLMPPRLKIQLDGK